MIKDTLIIFDIDGTLLFSNKIDSECFAQTFLERYGVTFPSIDWNYFPHVTDHTIFREAYHEIHQQYPDNSEIEDFRKKFVERIQQARMKSPEAFMMVPGAKSLFHHLETNKVALGIGTGGWLAPASVKLKHVNLYHEELVVSAADQKHKREDIVQEAIDRCEKKYGKTKRMVYVGDALWDIKTCRNMEIPMIGLRKDGDHDLLHGNGVSHVLSNYLNTDDFFLAVENAKVPD